MSNNTNIPNEDELWGMLSGTPSAEPAEAPAPEAKPEPAAEVPAESEIQAEPKAEAAPKSAKKVDKFFITCMACVAAVSVAVTALVCNMTGGTKTPGISGTGGEDSAFVSQLEQENAELRAQLQLQADQIKELQKDLLTLMGSEEYLSTISTDPDENNDHLNAQIEALDTLAKIQEAYANFDRAALEELIPQMDSQLSYLTPEALTDYYMILEYVEMPSNDE